ncbi:MAG: hypothetical protein WCG80_09760 [Spirochaetales bacterium]
MKRIVLAFLAVALTGVGAFADDAANAATLTVPSPLTAAITADGYVQAGVDLDKGTFGFSNGYDFGFTFNLLPGTGVAHGDGTMTGTLSVSAIRLFHYDGVGLSAGDPGNGLAGTAPTVLASIGDVVAKLVIGDLWIQLGDNGAGPGASVNYQPGLANDSGFLTSDDTFYTYSGVYGGSSTEYGLSTKGAIDPSAAAKGLSFGYTLPNLVGLTGSVASLNDWKTAGTNVYEVKGEASVLVDSNLTLVAAYAMSTAASSDAGVGIKAGYNVGILSPLVGVDFNLTTSKYSAVVGSKAALVKDLLNLAAYAQYDATGAAAVANAAASLEVTAAPLGLKVATQLTDLTGTLKDTINAQLTFAATPDIGVWAKMSFDNLGASNALFAKAGVDIAKLLPMTTLSLEYDSNDLMGTSAILGEVFTTLKVTY